MPDSFETNFRDYIRQFTSLISTDGGDWSVKGFIDVFQNVFTISGDTKVISKIIELMIFPKIILFAQEHHYSIKLSHYQNHYPDVTFISREAPFEKIALDIKSTYRLNETDVNGMTLGAFSGYFRDRASNKNITYPYQEYSKHYILGVIYSRTDMVMAIKKMTELQYHLKKTHIDKLDDYISSGDEDYFLKFMKSMRISNTSEQSTIKDALEGCIIDESGQYHLNQLSQITSVVKDFDFFLQEKWKIASDKPGSGNTKNIGSTKKIDNLLNGKGLFTEYERGFDFFNDYWMYYMTDKDAKAQDLPKAPYNNLSSYFDYKNIEVTEINER